MRASLKLVLFSLMLMTIISVGGTFSYFSDTASCSSNTLRAGVWNTTPTQPPQYLNISQCYTSGTKLFVSLYAKDKSVTIDKIQVSWDTSVFENTPLRSIYIGNTPFVSDTGGVPSGTILDGTNYMLNPNALVQMTFTFHNSHIANQLNIKFFMTDGSTQSVAVSV